MDHKLQELKKEAAKSRKKRRRIRLTLNPAKLTSVRTRPITHDDNLDLPKLATPSVQPVQVVHPVHDDHPRSLLDLDISPVKFSVNEENENENVAVESVQDPQHQDVLNETVHLTQELFREQTSSKLQEFKEKCSGLVRCEEDSNRLVHVLEKHDLYDDFSALLTMITEETIDPQNICLLSLLDTVRMLRNPSTTNMRYREKCKLFWNLVKMEGHGKILRFLSGPKNVGSLVQGGGDRGRYKPDCAKINFCIPSSQTLNKMTRKSADDTPPGIIQSNIDSLDKNLQYCISVDGKQIARGIDNEGEGEVDLWRLGPSPNKYEKNERFRLLDNFLNSLDLPYPSEEQLFVLLNETSSCIKDLRNVRVNEEARRTRLVKLQESTTNPEKYQYAMSAWFSMEYKCVSTIAALVKLNDQIAAMMAHIKSRPYHKCDFEKAVPCRQIQNARFLRHFDDLKNMYNLTDPRHLHILPQKNDLWKEIRKKSKVTGSTVYNAIGMRSVGDMKRHYREFILHKEVLAPKAEVQLKMDHGTKHEVSAFATVAMKYLPALRGKAMLREVGPGVIASARDANFACVSADGIFHLEDESEDIVLEIKCPYPSKNKYLPLHYVVPNYYVPQLLLEMKANDCQRAVYCTFSTETKTASFIECEFDEELYTEIFTRAEEVLEQSEYKDLHQPEYKATLAGRLKKYTHQKCQFVAELPAVTCDDTDRRGGFGPSAYASLRYCTLPEMHMDNTSGKTICDIARKCFKKTHDILREQAVEVLVFIASNLDRQHSNLHPLHIPVAYALKGPSLQTEVMRKMLDVVRAAMLESGCKVLAELWDGQWRVLGAVDVEGKPLNRLQLQKDTWKMVSKRGRKILTDDLLALSTPTFSYCWVFGKHLHVFSTCPEFKKHMITSPKKFKMVTEELLMQVEEDDPDSEHPLDKIPFLVGDQMNAFPEVPNISLDMDITLLYAPQDHFTDEDGTVDELALKEARKNCRNLNFLNMLLDQLSRKSSNKKIKWSELTCQDMLKFLQQPINLEKKLLATDLKIVDEVYQRMSGKNLFSRQLKLKAQKLNHLAKLFDSDSSIPTKKFHADSLLKICMSFVSRGVPKIFLQAHFAHVLWPSALAKWKSNSTVDLQPRVSKSGDFLDVFSYPERKMSSLVFCMVDPTHILTNLRAHCSRKGMPPQVLTQAWVTVSEKKPNLLSPSIVLDCIDKQNAEIAKRFFSLEVEMAMEEEKFNSTAAFVRVVRNWFDAVDKRGIQSDARVHFLCEMARYLQDGVDFGLFPPPGRYVKGIPFVTYEAILNNCSARVSLYKETQRKTYNQRALSTLAVESFFSSLTSCSPTGCPRAVQMSTLMKEITYLNKVKHNPDKGFHYITSNARSYTAHCADFTAGHSPHAGCTHDEPCHFKCHEFDQIPHNRRKERSRKSLVTTGLKPLCGVRGVRSHYKVDEAKILETRREGISERDLKLYNIL